MLIIPDELLTRLQNRVNKINNQFPCENLEVTFYVSAILKKHLNKLDHNELNNIGDGIEWKIFRGKHFREIYKRDKGQCQYCKKSLSKKEASLDHRFPSVRGGANTVNNMKLSCKWCNIDKAGLTDEEYYYKQLVNASKGIFPPK